MTTLPDRVRSQFAVLAGLALAGATTLGWPALTAAEEQSGLSIVGDGATPLKLQLQTNGGIRSVEFDVLVRNNSTYSGPLQIQFLDSASPDPSELVATPSYPAGKPVLSSMQPLPVTIGAFDVAQARMTLGILVDDKPAAIKGAVIARTVTASSAGVAVQRIEATDSTAAPSGSVSEALIAPTSTVVEITGIWPSLAWPDHPDWLFPSEPKIEISNADQLAASTKTGTQIVKTLIGGDHGGTGTIVLQRSDDELSNKISAGVRVLGLTKAGEYKDAISLDPNDDKAPTLDLVVKAQDLFIWPLLVLVLGVLASRQLLLWSDETRPKERLRAALKEAERDFATFMGGPDGLKCPFNWHSVFPIRDPRLGSGPSGDTRAEKALQAVDDASSQELLNEAASEVQALRELTVLLPELCKAHAALAAAVRAFPATLPKPPAEWPAGPAPIKVKSAELLRERISQPTTESVQDLIKRLRDQVTTLKLWAQAWATYTEARAAYDVTRTLDLPADIRAQLDEAEPTGIAKVELWTAIDLEELTDRRVDEKLRASWTLAESIIRAHSQFGSSESEMRLMLPMRMTAFGYAVRWHIPGSAPVAPARAEDVRTPEQIRASMRRHDWLEFIVSAAIASVVSLLAIYVGKNFGSTIWDYVSAFVAGIAGSVVINWALLPWYRKYNASGDLATPTGPTT